MNESDDKQACYLLLIEAALLLAGEMLDRSALEALCAYSHGPWRLLLVMNEPEQWQPTRRSMDRHLLLQQSVHDHLTRLGSHLDGAIYLPSPLIGRRQKRAAALSAVSQRVTAEPAAVWYIGCELLNLKAAEQVGYHIIAVNSTLTKQPPAATWQLAPNLDVALNLFPKIDTLL